MEIDGFCTMLLGNLQRFDQLSSRRRRVGSQVERCLLRRQQEEATALQELLAAMHQDLFGGLQRLASEVERRLERLEERLSRSEEVGHVWTSMAF